MRPLPRYAAATASRNAIGSCADAVESSTCTRVRVQRVVAAREQRLVLRRRPTPVRRRVRLVPDDDRRGRRGRARAPLVRSCRSARCAPRRGRCRAPKPKTASTTVVLRRRRLRARELDAARPRSAPISPCHGTHTRTAPAPTSCSRRTTVSGNGVHLSVSSSTPTMSGALVRRVRHLPDAEADEDDGDRDRGDSQAAAGCEPPQRLIEHAPAGGEHACAGRGAPSGRRSTRGRARASPPSTSRSRAAPVRSRSGRGGRRAAASTPAARARAPRRRRAGSAAGRRGSCRRAGRSRAAGSRPAASPAAARRAARLLLGAAHELLAEVRAEPLPRRRAAACGT